MFTDPLLSSTQVDHLTSHRATSNWRMPAVVVVVLLFLVAAASTLVGCGAVQTPASGEGVSPAPASLTPSHTPTLMALPTVAAAAPKTPTATPSPTPTQDVATTSPAPTATWTATPEPITPTITPTPKPTLTPTPMFSPTPLPTAIYSGEVLHILLIGLDSTVNLGTQNTDVVMVAAINKDTKQVSFLSVPRDLWVYVPEYGWSRLNIAHKIGHRTGYPGGGPGLLADTLRVNLGIPIDHWVRLDFQGFARVVDALGGVEMTVACPVNLRYKPPTSEGEQEMILEPGVHHMDGATALRYVRTRRGSSDFDRVRRQQQFLKALWNQTKSPDTLLIIPSLWSALAGSYKTDLSLGDVVSLAPLTLDIKPERIRSRYIGPNQTSDWSTADDWSVLLPDYDKIQQVVASLYAPPSTTEDQVSTEGARLQVRNGTYRHQLAKIGAGQLRWYGFNIVDTALADNPNYQQTKIVVFNEKPKALELLVRLLDVKPENIVHQIDPNQPADIQVILGQDYDPCR